MLTNRKKLYATARFRGLDPQEAALEAGVPEKSARTTAYKLEVDPDVQEWLARAAAAAGGHLPDTVLLPSAPRRPEPEPEPEPLEIEYETDPLKFMERMMNHPLLEPKIRLDSAKALAQYTTAKPGDKGKKEARADAAKIASEAGKFAIPKPPTRGAS